MLQNSHDFGRMVFVNPIVVLSKSYIQQPRQAIFNGPMITTDAEAALSRRIQTGNKTPRFSGRLTVRLVPRNDFNDAVEVLPYWQTA